MVRSACIRLLVCFPGPRELMRCPKPVVWVPVWDGRSPLQSSLVQSSPVHTHACSAYPPTHLPTCPPAPPPRSRQAPSKKMTYAVVAVASLAVVPTAFGQCPVASFDSFDFSNVMVRSDLDRRAFARPDSLTRATLVRSPVRVWVSWKCGGVRRLLCSSPEPCCERSSVPSHRRKQYLRLGRHLSRPTCAPLTLSLALRALLVRQFRAAVADTLSGCQDGFAGAIQGQLGFRAAGLLGGY